MTFSGITIGIKTPQETLREISVLEISESRHHHHCCQTTLNNLPKPNRTTARESRSEAGMEQQDWVLSQVLHLSSISVRFFVMTSQEFISSPMKYLIKRKIPKSNTTAHWRTLTSQKEYFFTKGRHLLSSSSNMTENFTSVRKANARLRSINSWFLWELPF